MSATKRWLNAADKRHFTIQLLFAREGRRDYLRSFLDQWNAAGDIGQVYVYLTTIKGATGYAVLFSEFESFEAARQALDGLPGSLKRHGPFIRNVRDIEPVVEATVDSRGIRPSAATFSTLSHSARDYG
jgi:septal ring-binding cell division protein DamX